MSKFPFPCPAPPTWRVDWDVLDARYEWIRRMRGCPQDPVFHREGDVWTHVRMVCEALAGLDAWRDVPAVEREMVFAAALLHDEAKPACTRREDGRIVSRGHSQRGAIDARRILWEMDVDFSAREQVCALVRHHQSPFHLIDRPDAQRLAFRISQTARCDLLTMLARSDALGRDCADQVAILERIALFEEYCREQECLRQPRQFRSAHSRFLYFRTEGRDPNYLANDDARCEVTLMSGLPGSGKDAWVARHAADRPVVSLDAIREELGIESTGNQGIVVNEARERARRLLREGQDFLWNATNLSRDLRRHLVDLFTAYHARVRIVYVEASREALRRQNENRSDIVPEEAIERMMDRWEVPDVTEADAVEWWVCGEQAGR